MTNFTTTGNYLHSKLAVDMAISDTSITLGAGNGFPAGSATKPMIAVIWDSTWADPSLDDDREIVKIYRDSGDVYTLQAIGQEGTTHKAWSTGDNIAVVLTSGKIAEIENAITTIEQKDQFLGYYANETALRTAHPTGTAGEYAIVGTTDTVWLWDVDTTDWVDSGVNGAVTSVFGRTGVIVATAGDYDANQVDYDNTNGIITANDTNIQDAIESLDANATITGTGTFLSGTNTCTISNANITSNHAVVVFYQDNLDEASDLIGLPSSSTGSFTLTASDKLTADTHFGWTAQLINNN